MIWKTPILPALAALASLALTSVAGAKTLETDWCDIETPDVVSPGQPIVIKVTPKGDIPPGIQLAADLHWMKKEAYGGFLSWHPRRAAKAGQTVVFTHKPKIDERMDRIDTIVFLSPDGDFKNKTKMVHAEPIPVVMDPGKAAAQAAEAARRARPADATFKKSRLRIEAPGGTFTRGDSFEIKVHYKLDAGEHWGDGTRIRLSPLGPWIDNPDGEYTKSRNHIGYAGLGNRTQEVEPGEGTATFSFRLDQAHRHNDLSWMATFIGGDGRNWPWSVRGGGMDIVRRSRQFDLAVEPVGGLFTYAETPAVKVVWHEGSRAGEQKQARFKVTDADGNTVSEFERALEVGAQGDAVEVPLEDVTRRGVLLVEATIEGWGTRDATLARIPDVASLLGGKRSPFGATNLGADGAAVVARRLGLNYVRQFVNWSDLEPLQGEWRFDELDARIDACLEQGLQPWICLVRPPAWVLPDGVHGAGFEAFPFDAKGWEASAATIVRRYADKVWGFEWLNEIVPGGKTPQPVRDYIDFCRIGTSIARDVNPDLRIQAAGGLWPRNFRTDLLAQGLGQWIDVLPLHYNNMGGMLEARQDLATAGAHGVDVMDNESAAGLSVWGMPSREALSRSTMQSRWVLRNWPDALIGGASSVVYFGGNPQAAGNWTYLLDLHTPRPVVATLAVLSAKLGQATPVAKFFVDSKGLFHLFEQDGRAILVASSATEKDVRLTLRVGAASLLQTDYQGNETTLTAQEGSVSLTLGAMPVFLEGADLALLKAHAVLSVGTSRLPQPVPQATVVQSDRMELPFHVRNPYDAPLSGTLEISVPGGWATAEKQHFILQPGEAQSVTEELRAAPGATLPGRSDLAARVTLDAPITTEASQPFLLNLIRPESLGNLLANGGFEDAGKTPDSAAAWSGAGGKRYPSEGGLGLGDHVLRYNGADSPGWQQVVQTVELPAVGQTYLYTAWVWSEKMQAGSNLILGKKDGTTSLQTIPRVFSAGSGTSYWRLLTHRRETTPEIVRIGFQPTANGAGWALYDNIRFTLYEGTDFAAEAHRLSRPVVIDGKLDDWNFRCPIPLLCDNQLTRHQADYAWTPDNLSGVAWLGWDESSLYLAVQVCDDRHTALTGERTTEGDSLVVALHPQNRAAGTDEKAFAWHISGAVPGGGSGQHTLYRPAERSGGLSSGHLARDSSVYELAVSRDEAAKTTVYELRIPWSETGGVTPAIGSKMGLTLQLVDNDGAGKAAAMTWGGGLQPQWSPSAFGVATLVD